MLFKKRKHIKENIIAPYKENDNTHKSVLSEELRDLKTLSVNVAKKLVADGAKHLEADLKKVEQFIFTEEQKNHLLAQEHEKVAHLNTKKYIK